MNILITGANGFVGKHISKHFCKKYNTTFLTRDKLDLKNSDQVDSFFLNKEFDVCIHTAIVGGRTNPLINKIDDSSVLYDNLLMTFNLLKNKQKINNFINLSSGAELDKRKKINGGDFNNSFPIDYYGMSKNLISRLFSFYNFTNLRLYGIFGEYEGNERFIKNNIKKYINRDSIEIHQDKYWDFFYIEDLIKVIEFKLTNLYNSPNNIDLVYKEKHKLSDIAKKINKLSNHSVDIIKKSMCDGDDYIGDSKVIDSLNISLIGIDCGIKSMYNHLNEN